MEKELKKSSKAHTIYKLEDGTRVPGVTTICGLLAKPALIQWANKMGLDGYDMNKYVDTTANIGTLGHRMIVDYLENGTYGHYEDEFNKTEISMAQNSCLSFFEWQASNGLVLEKAEEPLVSEMYRFGGTLDLYGYVKGTKALVDIKTGNGIWFEHEVQVAGGYTLLLDEHNYKYDKVIILNVPRSPDETFDVRVIERNRIESLQRFFKLLVELYYLKRSLEGKDYGRKYIKKSDKKLFNEAE